LLLGESNDGFVKEKTMNSPDERLRMEVRQGAAIENEVERPERETAELGRYSIYTAVALSLICSLVALAIISKNHLANDLWGYVAILAVPIPISLYFRDRIILFGNAAYVIGLLLALGAAVVFGI
jgi:hypothetical protein